MTDRDYRLRNDVLIAAAMTNDTKDIGLISRSNIEESEPSISFNLSIIGVKNLADKDLSLFRRLLWILCLGSCCSLVAYYVSSRVMYILSLPTQVAVTLKQNESLQLPDVTLCPNTPFVPSKLVEMGMTQDGLPGANFVYNSSFNVSQLWEDISSPGEFISATSVNLGDSKQNWQVVFTTMGVCYTHHYDSSIQASGLNFGMSIRLDWDEIFFSRALSEREGLKVFFHTPKDPPLTEVQGINVAPREDVSIAIRIKEFKSLNRKIHPCISQPEYSRSSCVNNCFNRQLVILTQCRLPFMIGISEDWCESTETYQGAFRTFWKKSKSNLTLWAECGQSCVIECTKLIYTPYIESVSIAEDNVGKFIIYFPEMWYEIVEEKEAYDIIALLCDIGGTFGLFLGCSLLTLVELLEFIFLYFYRSRSH